MKVCKNCGFKNDDDAIFCVNCGKKFNKEDYEVDAKSDTKIESEKKITESSLQDNKISESKIEKKDLNPEIQERIILWKAYIQKNYDYYIEKFIEFYTTDKKFSFNIALFFSLPWTAYRKLYLLSLIGFILYMIPFAGILFALAIGFFGNYLYFLAVENQIKNAQMKAKILNISVEEYLRLKGGTNIFAVIIILILVPLGISLIYHKF